jgi:hypothetical protein
MMSRTLRHVIVLLALLAVLVGVVLGVVPGLVPGIAAVALVLVYGAYLVWGALYHRRNPHAREAFALAEKVREAADKNRSALAIYDELSALVARHPDEPALPGILAYAASRMRWAMASYPDHVNKRLDADIQRHIGKPRRRRPR